MTTRHYHKKKVPEGRRFKKGNPGRPKGAKDKIPRGSIKLLFKHYLMEQADTLYGTLKKILANPKLAGPMIRDMRDTIDGKPVQGLQAEGIGPLLNLVLSKSLDEDPLAHRTPIQAGQAKREPDQAPSEPKGLPGMVVIPDPRDEQGQP